MTDPSSPPCELCQLHATSARQRADAVALTAVHQPHADMVAAGARCADLELLAATWDQLATTHTPDTHRIYLRDRWRNRQP